MQGPIPSKHGAALHCSSKGRFYLAALQQDKTFPAAAHRQSHAGTNPKQTWWLGEAPSSPVAVLWTFASPTTLVAFRRRRKRRRRGREEEEEEKKKKKKRKRRRRKRKKEKKEEKEKKKEKKKRKKRRKRRKRRKGEKEEKENKEDEQEEKE